MSTPLPELVEKLSSKTNEAAVEGKGPIKDDAATLSNLNLSPEPEKIVQNGINKNIVDQLTNVSASNNLSPSRKTTKIEDEEDAADSVKNAPSPQPDMTKDQNIAELAKLKSSPKTDLIENDDTSVDSTNFNRSISDDDNDSSNLEVLRGDAIGNTLYSKRFVLRTILELPKQRRPLSDDEEYEQKLGSLWDMTLETDVVLFLLEHGIFELFAYCISTTDDKRLIEMLVGIMANMCSVKETRDELCKNATVVKLLLAHVDGEDALVLVQLMRLLTTTLVPADLKHTKQLFEYFCDSESFIWNFTCLLNNTMNTTLIRHAMETLNAILAKFALLEVMEEDSENASATFERSYVNAQLINSSITAFETLNVLVEPTDNENDTTQSHRKTNQIFLNTHCILSQYPTSRECYKTEMEGLFRCLDIILRPLREPLSLLPLSSYEQDVIDSVCNIVEFLDSPFDDKCFDNILSIWLLVKQENESVSTTNEFENDDDVAEFNVNYAEFCQKALKTLKLMIIGATVDELKQSVSLKKPDAITKLLAVFPKSDKEFESCGIKIKAALETFD